MKQKKYTSAQKIELLKILQLNDCNLQKTARENSVSIPTLKRWQNEFPEVMGRTEEIRKQRIDAFEKSLEHDSRIFFAELAEINCLAVKRAKQLMKKEENLATILKFFELYKSIFNTDGKDNEANNENNSVFNLFNQFNQLNQ
jgi:transposase-like protein